jgi:Spy/CpxP family protein refolding chaperone
MKKIICFIVACAAIMLFIAPVINAEPKDPMRDEPRKDEGWGMKKHGGGIFGNLVRMQKELGLTDAQVTSIADINKEYEKKALGYREKLAPKHFQLRKLFLEDNVDIDKVRSLLKEISDLRTELHILRIQHGLEIEKVLTPAQKAKVKQFRMNKYNKGKKHHPGPGPDM